MTNQAIPAAGVRSRTFDWITRLSLLASNLTPLALILAILSLRNVTSPWIWVFSIATLFGIATTIWILAVAQQQSTATRRVIVVEDGGGEVAGYLVSYTLPFLAVSSTDWYLRLAYFVFALVLIIVFVNSNLLAVSPLLYVFGYKLYRVKFDQEPESSYFTISRHRPQSGQQIVITKWGALLVRAKRDHHASPSDNSES